MIRSVDGTRQRPRRRVRLLRSIALAAGALFTCAPAPVASAASPYMGVDTWYAYGGAIDQQTVVDLTNAVVRDGLKAAGYRIVWLDAGWWPAVVPGGPGPRDPSGQILLNPGQWPLGMAWVTEYIHEHGLLAGIYTDAGPIGCSNGGSYGHYQQDADQFAAWGFDAVKIDCCGGLRTGMTPVENFAAFSAAIAANDLHRAMIVNICDPDVGPDGAGLWLDQWTFGPEVATSWRTGPDLGWPGRVTFPDVLRNVALDALHPEAATPGHFNDPDYLVPGEGMSYRQAQAQMTMWAILEAPLMLSANPAALESRTLAMYENPVVIAIDQDPLGVQGQEAWSDGELSEWTRPLALGRAVAYLNAGAVPATVDVTIPDDMVGIGGTLDVWTGRMLNGRVHLTVPANGAVLLESL
jgi:alpha-galactosidase